MGNRVFIHALTAISPDEELFIDYGLEIDGEITDEACAHYACHCGAAVMPSLHVGWETPADLPSTEVQDR